MNRTAPFAAIAALVVASLFSVAGCGAAPDGDSVGATGEDLVVTMCTKPLTTLQVTVSGGHVTSACVPVTQAPAVTSGPGVESPIAAPSQLEGCTIGLSIPNLHVMGEDFVYTANVWACPALSDGGFTGPTTLGTPNELQVDWGTTPDPNAFVGAANAGWVLVEQDVATGPVLEGHIGGGCRGGCIMPPTP
jgi:hypothetical protein